MSKATTTQAGVAYITCSQAAKREGVTPGRIRALLGQKRIPGAKMLGPIWMIPEGFQVLPSKKRTRGLQKIGGGAGKGRP